MLHQSRTLEGNTADKPQDRHETGIARAAGLSLADNMVEVSGADLSAPVTVVGSSADQSGLTACPGSSNRVFVLSKSRKPLMPCHPARARALLRSGRAIVHQMLPFTIRLKDRKTGAVQPTLVKLDPGSKTTGICVVRLETSNPKNQHVLFNANLVHRGAAIRDSLSQRKSFRRARRGRNLRYRAPRFLNRGGDKKGWLAPSLRHRIETTTTQVNRLRQLAPITGIEQELVRFDTQKLQNPETSGIQYQQGTLAGYEVREYLLEKWNRTCAYCDKKDVPLQIEHICARANGGSNRVGNLTLACEPCNTKKGTQDLRAFLAYDPKRLARIMAQATTPFSDSAAVNATRFALLRALIATGLPVATGTGAQTKFNRTRLGLPKDHAIDAACVGNLEHLTGALAQPITIKAMGRGSRQRSRLTKYGFPRGMLSPAKVHFGFRTGDIVKASVPCGKRQGSYTGRVAVRASGSFNIQTSAGTVQGISHRFCSLIQRGNGYAFAI
jgi:5-methylcytosine-specific restriction endonuclease McrA